MSKLTSACDPGESRKDFQEVGGYRNFKKPTSPECTCGNQGRHKHWCGAHVRWDWTHLDVATRISDD